LTGQVTPSVVVIVVVVVVVVVVISNVNTSFNEQQVIRGEGEHFVCPLAGKLISFRLEIYVYELFVNCLLVNKNNERVDT